MWFSSDYKVFSCSQAFDLKITQKMLLSSSCVKCRYAKEQEGSMKKRYGAVKEKKKTVELPCKEILCKIDL
jgi:hypothetical protein